MKGITASIIFIVCLVCLFLIDGISATTTTSPSENKSSTTDHIEKDTDKGGNNTQQNNKQQPSGEETISNGHTTYYYSNKQMLNKKYNDDQLTYIDIFGERAKELLTQHIIPSTDAECKWDWSMGRCEPYCACALYFLWGDYHVGRSCRYRTSFANEEEIANEKAWQQVYETQIQNGLEDDNDGSNARTCTLPPESRYIQIIKKIHKGTVVLDQFRKVKSASIHAANVGLVHGKHHWTTMRHTACETVKSKIEERANLKDQPVVLTKHGATLIRTVCGTSSEEDSERIRGGEDTPATDEEDDNDGVGKENTEDIAQEVYINQNLY